MQVSAFMPTDPLIELVGDCESAKPTILCRDEDRGALWLYFPSSDAMKAFGDLIVTRAAEYANRHAFLQAEKVSNQ